MKKNWTSGIVFVIVLWSVVGSFAAEKVTAQESPKHPKTVTLVWPGDFHLTGPTETTALDIQKVIAEANVVIKPDFIHLAGDNTDDGTEVEYQLLKSILAAAQMPVYPMIGDHDVKNGVAQWQKHFGKPYYSFDFGGYHWVTLNSMDGNAQMKKAGFRDEQLGWLESDLAHADHKHLPSILAWHYYPPEKLGDSWERIRQIIEKHHVLGVLTGHAHFNQITNHGKVAVITTRTILSPRDNPNTGYAVVSVDAGTLSWKFKELAQEFPFVMITHPTRKILATNASAVVKGVSRVRAKAFGDQEITLARYRVDQGEWMSMLPTSDTGVWDAPFDSRGLSDAEHTMDVQVTDAKNRTATDQIVMLVDQDGQFTPTEMQRVPEMIPGAAKKPYAMGHPTILMDSHSALRLPAGSIWMMTANGLQEEEISFLTQLQGVRYAGGRGGLFSSRGGAPFVQVKKFNNDPEQEGGFSDVTAIVTDQGGTLYVSTHHDGIFKKRNGGASWNIISQSLAEGVDDFHVHSLVVDAKDRLYAATASGIFRTDDSGNNWHEVGLNDLYVKTMTVDQDDSTIYAGTKEHGGLGFAAVYRSPEGTTWEQLGGNIPKEEGIEAIYLSTSQKYVLTKNGLYVLQNNQLSLDKERSLSMGFVQKTKGESDEAVKMHGGYPSSGTGG